MQGASGGTRQDRLWGLAWSQARSWCWRNTLQRPRYWAGQQGAPQCLQEAQAASAEGQQGGHRAEYGRDGAGCQGWAHPAHTGPSCSHADPQRVLAPWPRRRRHRPGYQRRGKKEGCGLAGEARGAQHSSESLWANTVVRLGPPSSLAPVYRSAWPSLGAVTAKRADNAINKHPADSRGAFGSFPLASK